MTNAQSKDMEPIIKEHTENELALWLEEQWKE